MLTDIEIAKNNKMQKITTIAKKANIPSKYLELYGNYKAKVDLGVFEELKEKKSGKLVLVSAINPTKAGEGKTTMTIGLTQALSKIGVSSIAALREPSMGPVFGLKGGACGGGYAQVVPMEDINLHFTGDMHAIGAACNLIAAIIDNHIYQGNELNIDPTKVVWKRCIDMNDRTLRDITIAQGSKVNGVERKDGFIITVASEIMALLCLSNSLEDFRAKLENILVAYSYDDKPIYVRDLQISGAICIIMKDAIKPNLVQTLEHTPILIHGGPFANIAHGCNSILATKLAMKLADITVTEAGFGADLGAEKFLDIKCREANLKPNLVVLVATIRALKMHGGSNDYNKEDLEALKKGLDNLFKHIENIKKYHLPYVVAINRFSLDSKDEINLLESALKENNHPCYLVDYFAKGSKGDNGLASYVAKKVLEDNDFNYLYDLKSPIKTKIETICKEIYGASKVNYSDKANEDIKHISELGYDDAYICIAKTPNSLSDDPTKLGVPKDFEINVREVRLSSGCKFVIPLLGNILTLPGLGKRPQAMNMDIDKDGNIRGLS